MESLVPFRSGCRSERSAQSNVRTSPIPTEHRREGCHEPSPHQMVEGLALSSERKVAELAGILPAGRFF
jgi:hypothetical protein